jgi:hypothetical protein
MAFNVISSPYLQVLSVRKVIDRRKSENLTIIPRLGVSKKDYSSLLLAIVKQFCWSRKKLIVSLWSVGACPQEKFTLLSVVILQIDSVFRCVSPSFQ